MPDEELLALLDADPVKAAAQYTSLYDRLVKFFEWRRCASPEDLAQDVLMRGMRRIRAGVQIETTLVQYFYGVANHVLLEERRADQKEERLTAPLTEVAGSDDLGSVERKIYLRQVLSRLPRDDRELIVRYHLSDRTALKRRLGLTAEALRVRVHRVQRRIREELGKPRRSWRQVK
jgi:RNA polymerase sigma factor (sigma-70 family)